ncbi:hypothetical protein J4H86_13645 [Spiractinospora alimapuensis]|uniref:hypothetical protein n=1 Tax=Spiractinospora alimapuensis TaxID=2820884 RepID=UPI001F2BFD97|nr:hypothetical protein [Spiractinospora alimapuensis]QVQ50017.1 hypothetical protein J4H86_13645 [Spiractinospora alimapuensis]
MRSEKPIVIELRGVTAPLTHFVSVGLLLYVLLAATGASAVFFLEKLGVIMDDVGAGWTDLRTWGLGLATVVLIPFSVAMVRLAVVRAPRQLARRECVISSEGIELIRHRKRWSPEMRLNLPWSDIHAITTNIEFLSRRHARRTHRHRTMLIALRKEIPRNGEFQVIPKGGPIPRAHRSHCRVLVRGINLGLRGAKNRDMLAIAEAIERIRPGLFQRGVNKREWFPQ